jgi:ribonuclease PH
MTSLRKANRPNDQLRDIILTPDYIKNVNGSVLIEQGHTRVVCTAICESRVPYFLRNSGQGWLDCEYGMLPGSTGSKQRSERERLRVNNRNIEIQRFIGRALRTTFNLKKIDGKTIHIDSDVVQADGGTRCASINGGMIALGKALRYLVYENIIPHLPDLEYIAAVSIGVKGDTILVDMDYDEDSSIDSDINIVSSEKGSIVEIQAFGEAKAIPRELFHRVIDMGVEINLDLIAQLKACVHG